MQWNGLNFTPSSGNVERWYEGITPQQQNFVRPTGPVGALPRGGSPAPVLTDDLRRQLSIMHAGGLGTGFANLFAGPIAASTEVQRPFNGGSTGSTLPSSFPARPPGPPGGMPPSPFMANAVRPAGPPAGMPAQPYRPMVAGRPDAPVSRNDSYAVRAGDTLWDIAKRLTGDGRNYKQIAAANGIADPSRLKVGQTLRLGGSGSASAPRPATMSASLASSRKSASAPVPRPRSEAQSARSKLASVWGFE